MTLSEEPLALAVIIGLALELLTFLGGMYFFARRFPLEKIEKVANANNDNATAELAEAEANAKRIENSNRMVELLIERDNQIAELSGKITQLTLQVADIGILRERLDRTSKELDTEREQRVRLETALADEKARSETYRHERDELQQTVKSLSERLDVLEAAYQNSTQTP